MTTYADPPQRTDGRPRKRVGRDEPPLRPGRKDPRWAKLSIILGAVVMVISGATVIGPKIVALWAFDNVDQTDVIPPELKGADISGPINFLLLGIDERREGADSDSPLRADSIVVVHIPAGHDRVFMISLPRDLRVQIPPFPEIDFPGWHTKINAAFAEGAVDQNRQRDPSAAGRGRGAVLTMMTISDIVKKATGTGLKFNGWATIDFEGFDAVVNALGGVYMCIDQDVKSIHYMADGSPAYDILYNEFLTYGYVKTEGYHYKKDECRDMQPWEALDYSRQRVGLPNTDYDRQRHQQQLLKAIIKKIASADTLTNFNTIRNLQQAAGELLTLDLGGNKIEDWVFTLSSLRADDMIMVKTYAGQARGEVVDEISYERLDQDLIDLLKSVQSDTVFDFLSAHPDWVAES